METKNIKKSLAKVAAVWYSNSAKALSKLRFRHQRKAPWRRCLGLLPGGLLPGRAYRLFMNPSSHLQSRLLRTPAPMDRRKLSKLLITTPPFSVRDERTADVVYHNSTNCAMHFLPLQGFRFRGAGKGKEIQKG